MKIDLKFEALKRGFFQHKQQPALIKQVSLDNYLIICDNRTRLVKEIAYCLSTPSIEDRLRKDKYRIAFNSCSFSLEQWKYKIVYNKTKNYKKLADLLIVDIPVLNNVDSRERLFLTYPWLK